MRKMILLFVLVSNIGCAGMQAQLKSISNPDPDWIEMETGRGIREGDHILVHAKTEVSTDWQMSISKCRLEAAKILMIEKCTPHVRMEGKNKITSYDWRFYGFSREASHEKGEIQHCLYSLPADEEAVEDLMSLPPNS